jgi:hypothetical protein
MNPKEPTDIKKHPLLEKAYNLCLAIEDLPASEQQTKVSLQASELVRAIWLHLPE